MIKNNKDNDVIELIHEIFDKGREAKQEKGLITMNDKYIVQAIEEPFDKGRKG